ncbi:MAG TPA: hypothetical protein PLD59_05385 [Tepidisphaeraceae bacterium]|nr:hypothetical protein [Tepidisphaeraceae bacterium]
MNWLLLAGCALIGWVALCVVSGERARRVQAKEVERMAIDQLGHDPS